MLTLDFFNNWLRKIETKFCNGRDLPIRENLEIFSQFISEELRRYFPGKTQGVRTGRSEENEERRQPSREVEEKLKVLRERLNVVHYGGKAFCRISDRIKNVEEMYKHQSLGLVKIF